MRHIVAFLEHERTSVPETTAELPSLAARAFMELSLVRKDQPYIHKKKRPVFRHEIRSKDHNVKRVGDHFPIDVKLARELELPFTDDPSHIALGVVSMIVDETRLSRQTYEFSDGNTSISNLEDSCTKTETGIWVVANAWRPLDVSVREYLRLQLQNIQEYGTE